MIRNVPRKTALCIGLIFLLAAGAGWSQTPQDLLKSYLRNFAIASLDVKVQIVLDAGQRGLKELGPLYLQAVDYVLENFSLLETDQRFRTLALAALTQVRATGFAEARHSVWKLFQTDTSQDVRQSALDALAVIGKGDAEVARSLTLWLEAQNTVFQTGKVPEVPVILSAVKALGALGDPISFPVLFATMNLGYTDEVSRQARLSLLAIPGDHRAQFIGILRDSSLPEKQLALSMAMEFPRLSDADKGAIAEFALDVGLHTAASDNQSRPLARELRFQAARTLTGRRWSKATPLAIEHFDALLLEYERGLADRRFLIEAINLLGDMGTHEAAVRLTQYLVQLNAYTERVREFDSTIVLAVIENLGRLGDKVAFDDLQYVEYLKSYSPEVLAAARKVRAGLKW
jgi:HEAT repeat protein